MSTYYTNSYLTGTGNATYGSQLGSAAAGYQASSETRRPGDGSPVFSSPRSPSTNDYGKYGPYNGALGSPTSPGPTSPMSPAPSSTGSFYGADYPTRRLQSPFSPDPRVTDPRAEARPSTSSPSPGPRKDERSHVQSLPQLPSQLLPINMSNSKNKQSDRPASTSSSTSPMTADDERDEFDDDNSAGSSGENSNAGNSSANIPIYPWMKSQFGELYNYI